jgi:hypothetical protein
MNNKVTLVIAAYKEDLSWLDNITNEDINIVIINKGDITSHPKAEVHTIKNLGVCDHSFLYYISNNYNSLYDYTIFIQANPFDHYSKTVEFINNKEYLNGFYPLADQSIHIPRGEGTTLFVEGILDFEFKGVHFPCGAQYSVPKENILSKPKYFWDDLLNIMPWEEDWFIPYFMERCWIFIYDPNIKINFNYLETPYFANSKK